VGFDDLHVVVIEQIAGGVIDLGHGQLEIDLGLNEIQLGLGQLGLGVQNEEHRLGAEFPPGKLPGTDLGQESWHGPRG
jgi:hypothetical protein